MEVLEPTAAHPTTVALKPNPLRRLVAGPVIVRMAGFYMLVLLVAGFTIWGHPSFGTMDNARVVASSQAIAGVLTMGVVVSLIAGVFDISLAANMTFAISFVGWLQGEANVNPVIAVALTLAAGALIGALNALVITKLHVEPVIATLGMSALLAAATYWLVEGQTILYGISPSFIKFGTGETLSIPNPVFYFAGVSMVLWYALEHTPWGRYLRATGANPQASKLAGVKIVRMQWSALILAGGLAALAGVVLTMQVGAASFGAGRPYLLPAFAAAFLGSTLIQPGRFNVLGTVVALYLLAVAVKGLQLSYPGLPWIADFIQGLTLIGAVAIAGFVSRRRGRE